jgi:hypothetical protein
MSGPLSVTASFTANPATIVTSTPTGFTITVDSVPVTTPATFYWTPGASHTLAAAATISGPTGTQYAFQSWSQGGNASQSVTAGSSTATYTAAYQTQYYLTTSAGAGGTIAPASAWFNSGTLVTVTATPNTGEVLASFSGALTGSTNPQNLTMNGPATVTAAFNVAATPINLATNPSGLLVSVDGAAAQATPFIAQLTAGAHTIAVAATQAGSPGTQYAFTGWSDSRAASHSITVGASPATYTATFQTQYQLTTSAYPSAGGTVTPASGNFYNAGSVVSVQETTNAGYQFAYFSGGTLTGSTNPQNVTMNGPINVVADFTPLAPNMAVSVGARTISGSQVLVGFTLTNGGLGTATNATITSITASVISGSGTVTVASGVPVDLGTINSGGGTASTIVTFNWPSTAARVTFTVHFTADGGYSGSGTATTLY